MYAYGLKFVPFMIGAIAIAEVFGLHVLDEPALPATGEYAHLAWAIPSLLLSLWLTWRHDKKDFGDAPGVATIKHALQMCAITVAVVVLIRLIEG